MKLSTLFLVAALSTTFAKPLSYGEQIGFDQVLIQNNSRQKDVAQSKIAMQMNTLDADSALYDVTLKQFSKFWDVESAKELIHHLANTSPELVKAVECNTAKGCSIALEDLGSELKEWVKEHPAQAAFYIVDGLIILQPEFLSVGILRAWGFRFIGVEAGSAAVSLQRYLGPLMKRSTFSYLQSAAMYGYGRFAVRLATRFAALLAAAFEHFFGY